jgi:hypothetical protein
MAGEVLPTPPLQRDVAQRRHLDVARLVDAGDRVGFDQ